MDCRDTPGHDVNWVAASVSINTGWYQMPEAAVAHPPTVESPLNKIAVPR
jgi:hypothetical protein